MKKKLKFFIGIAIIMVVVLAIFIAVQINQETYKITIPSLDEITLVSIDSLSQYDNVTEFDDKEEIAKIYHIFRNQTTTQESINDNPVNPDILFLVTFKKNDETTKVYIYKKNNQYYIEQPYNGIYTIAKRDFETIQNLVTES
ncbi:MAG TPA: DUF5301 domain-containing protein [Candidatus Faecenecus gallistercoris]|uniref:DUF5301 domain-containing protein n=1 Tax=Candidatus Faecenecus gallistercoris TaxID=2840793 RepID=A0A9D0Z094_9FIRM|nr:DUF5301 domain-containing protein [Candidatus Faecenecus gallistercoris]